VILPPSTQDVVPERWEIWAVNVVLACIVIVGAAEAVRSTLVLLR